MSTEASPAPPLPTQDETFLHGIDLDSPASIARSIAMQIRVRGHFQGRWSSPVHAACIVASAAFARATLDQRVRFESALRSHIDDPRYSDARTLSLIDWNDKTSTEKVIETLESLPFPDPPAEGTCDR